MFGIFHEEQVLSVEFEAGEGNVFVPYILLV